ncbi:MAG TPA: SMC-Scp complex subunit ScpB [Holophaga sp.]|nr:SMC-Scp complex subunit ScpB [Holophaga sp.]
MNDEIPYQTNILDDGPLWEAGGDLPGALEALFVATGEVLDLARLQELTGIHEGPLRQAIEKLQERLQPPRGLKLIEVAGGWRMATAPHYASLVSKLVTTIRSGRLTPAQIEALAIIAYRQPVTVPELNEIRGVTSSSNQVKSLLERELIVPAGRKPVVGRPMTYATTQKFLIHFGLNSLNDLPRLADFGEGPLEAQALAQLEPPLPAGNLFEGIEDDPEDLLTVEDDCEDEAAANPPED